MQGPQGDRGPQGSVGSTGAQGVAGPVGPSGELKYDPFAAGVALTRSRAEWSCNNWAFGVVGSNGVCDPGHAFIEQAQRTCVMATTSDNALTLLVAGANRYVADILANSAFS